MEKSSFFNSVGDDRVYQASDFAAYFNSLITNGVFPNPSTNLQIISNNNMTVTIKAGKAWINGYVYINDSDLILPISVADGVLKRIDRIVIQFNTINRNITAKVKKGTFASTPVALDLQRDADAYELGIADILISNGATTIIQASITDLRMNTIYCGWVNSLIQVDTTAIFNQYQAWYTSQQNVYNTDFTSWTVAKKAAYDEWYTTTTNGYATAMTLNETQFKIDFEAWFATVQNQLNGDIAGNLTNAINALAGTGRTTETVKGNAAALALHLTDNIMQFATKVDKTDYVRSGSYGVTTGTSTAYEITLNPMPTTYVDGMQLIILPHVTSGAIPTLNVNGLGALTILKQDGTALIAGDIIINKPLGLVRVGSNFFIRSSSGGSNIKSIQRGSVTLTTTTSLVTISPINIANSIVRVFGQPDYGDRGTSFNISGTITSPTTVMITRGGTEVSVNIKWEVIEFNNVKNKQTGIFSKNATQTIIPNNTYVVNIASINISKSMLFCSLYQTQNNEGYYYTIQYEITNATTISFTIVGPYNANINIVWQVIEFN